jgi:hypothetical protein
MFSNVSTLQLNFEKKLQNIFLQEKFFHFDANLIASKHFLNKKLFVSLVVVMKMETFFSNHCVLLSEIYWKSFTLAKLCVSTSGNLFQNLFLRLEDKKIGLY